ncbi:MAG: iron-containing alcohol dehydrogenase [Nitrospirota bacterium]
MLVGIAFAGVLVVPSSGARPAEREDGRLQELIGARIQALGRYDVQRQTVLLQRGSDIIRTASLFDAGRDARLQETLGQSIAGSARSLFVERAALDAALADARDTERRLRSGGWFQEHLGSLIVQTAASVPPDHPRFLERLESRIKVLAAIEHRVARDTDARVAVLSARQAQYPRDKLARLAAAVEDGHRAARMFDASHDAWAERRMGEIQEGLAFWRAGEDYQRLVEAVKSTLRPYAYEWGAGGFWEYGAASLIGILIAMAWVGATTPAELRRRADVRTLGGISRAPLSRHWKGEGAMAQVTTLFSWPREVMFGSHCARDVGRYAARDHVKQAMIVTDPGVVQKGLVDPVKASLIDAGVACEVIDDISPEVPHTAVVHIAGRCKQAGAELLVAVGGGSVIDTAKAVGILLSNAGSIQDYEGVDRVGRAITTLYVVPTTAGCGSETSQFCIVLDVKRKKKFEIFSRKLIPERIFIDPMMTRSMPPDLTASSGMEALANAVEAYCSTWASPLTDTLALNAVRLISENLRAAVANGQDVQARQYMSLAAFEAGLAFTNAQSGAVHALGHSLSGMFDIPQRIGDAILLPHVMKANMNANMWRMANVAEALGEPVAGPSPRAAAQRAIEAVKLLLVDVGLPTNLAEAGVDKNALSSLSERALEDTFLRTNPRALNLEDIEAIYEDAFVEYAGEEAAPGRRTRAPVH